MKKLLFTALCCFAACNSNDNTQELPQIVPPSAETIHEEEQILPLPLSDENIDGIAMVEGASVTGHTARIDAEYERLLTTYITLLSGHRHTNFELGDVFEPIDHVSPTVYLFRDDGNGFAQITVTPTNQQIRTRTLHQEPTTLPPTNQQTEITQNSSTQNPQTSQTSPMPMPTPDEAEIEAELGRRLYPARNIGGRTLTLEERIARTPPSRENRRRGMRFTPPPNSLGE